MQLQVLAERQWKLIQEAKRQRKLAVAAAVRQEEWEEWEEAGGSGAARRSLFARCRRLVAAASAGVSNSAVDGDYAEEPWSDDDTEAEEGRIKRIMDSMDADGDDKVTLADFKAFYV